MPVADRTQGIALPTGPAATQRITLELDQGGWEFASKAAVQILATPGLGDARSGATMVLAPQDDAVDPPAAQAARPRPTRRPSFLPRPSNLFVPGPGVVDGYARDDRQARAGSGHRTRPGSAEGLHRGRRCPAGPSARGGSTRRRDACMSRSSRPRRRRSSLTFESQLGAGALPFDLSLEPLQVAGAAGQVGLIALAFGPEAQPESVTPADLSAGERPGFRRRASCPGAATTSPLGRDAAGLALRAGAGTARAEGRGRRARGPDRRAASSSRSTTTGS